MLTHLPTSADNHDFSPAEREQQRIAHLVLGAPRPKIKTGTKSRRAKAAPSVILAPEIEGRVRMRERWSHKTNGTPETHEHAYAEAQREGALARLVMTGALNAHHLAAAEEIEKAYRAVTAEVAVRTAKLEPRSTGGGPMSASAPHIGAVILDRAYSAWREAVHPHGAMLLSIIIDDVGVTIAARHARMSNRRCRALLIDALDRWRRR